VRRAESPQRVEAQCLYLMSQDRPAVAKWLVNLSLGTKLSWFVALIVVAVVTSVAYLEIRSFEQHIEGDLEDSARLGAQSAADALSQRSPPFDPRHSRHLARLCRGGPDD